MLKLVVFVGPLPSQAKGETLENKFFLLLQGLGLTVLGFQALSISLQPDSAQ